MNNRRLDHHLMPFVTVAVVMIGLGSGLPGGAGSAQAQTASLTDAGLLLVDGTTASDLIVVNATDHLRTVRVTVNGTRLGPFRPVRGIEVHAGAGNDTVRIDPQLELPAKLEGGPGKDRLVGGSGPHQFFGGDGDDVMVSGGRRDAFVGGPGDDRWVLRSGKLGTLLVGPAASGETLRLLERMYEVRPASSHQARIGPVIVGATDLKDSQIRKLVRRAYAAGETVALTGATRAQAARWLALVGHAGQASWTSDEARMDLISLRRVHLPDGRTHEVTEHVALGMPATSQASKKLAEARKRGERHRLELLSRAFAETAVVPEPSLGDDPDNLLQLAESKESKSTGSDNDLGNTIQLVTNVWSARSFGNQFDIYFFEQELDASLNYPFGVRSWTNSVGTFPDPLNGTANSATLIQPSPQSTLETTTVTSGVTQNYSGTIGYNRMQGVNVSGTAGVSIVNSKTTQVPPIEVINQPQLPVTGWTYEVKELPSTAETLDLYQQWIWEVAFSLYPSNIKQYVYAPGASMLVDYDSNPSYELDTPQITPAVPLPFGTSFTIDKPVITGLSSSIVDTGGQFTINGTGFYPALVTAVLIDGSPLQPTQYVVNSPQSITATAPDSGALMPVQVQTTEGFSNDDLTITACEVICAAPARTGSRQASGLGP